MRPEFIVTHASAIWERAELPVHKRSARRLPFGAHLAPVLLAPTALMALWAGMPVIAWVGLSEQFPTMGALAGT